jgi:BlaI family transcriptional regulator, penicillinase repressor
VNAPCNISILKIIGILVAELSPSLYIWKGKDKKIFIMRELTRAEEEVMQVLWKLKKGFVKEILEHFDDPKPAYNTVSTIVRILQDKGFVNHKAYGRTHEYFPVVSKEAYSKMHLKTFVKDYFSNSFDKMVSFFAREKGISVKEMGEIMKIMEGEINKQKGKK